MGLLNFFLLEHIQLLSSAHTEKVSLFSKMFFSLRKNLIKIDFFEQVPSGMAREIPQSPDPGR
jgi:hypothetical protein